MLCIALSFHTGSEADNAYEYALKRRAAVLGLPVEIFAAARPAEAYVPDTLKRAHAVCLLGGADVEPGRYGYDDTTALCTTEPGRDASEFAMLAELDRQPKPLLAICRGAQLLNVHHGGTLVPDLGERNATHRAPPPKSHAISVIPDTLLAGIAGTQSCVVNSYHHQAVDRLAPRYRPAAYADDGTLEAYELREGMAAAFTVAVQWHPEQMIDDPLSAAIFDAFLNAAAATG